MNAFIEPYKPLFGNIGINLKSIHSININDFTTWQILNNLGKDCALEGTATVTARPYSVLTNYQPTGTVKCGDHKR